MEDAPATPDERLRELESLRQRVAELESGQVSDPGTADDLRQLAEVYQVFHQHIRNVFYSHTPDHVLTYMSPQTKELLGCEPEEALVRWTEFVTDHPNNEVGFERTQRAIDTGERQEPYELQLKHRDGRLVWVEVHEAPVVRDERTVAIVGALADITPRKRMEQLLRTELALSLSLESAPTLDDVIRRALDAALTIDEVCAGGLYVVDDATGDLVLRVHHGLSDEFVEGVRHITSEDVRASMVKGDDQGAFIHRDGITSGEGLLVAGIFPIRHEGRFVACLNAASRTVEDFSPHVFDALEMIAGQVGPVISRLRAETSLRQSEATLQGVFRAAPAGIGVVRNRELQWVNEHMARMTGYEEEELIGRNSRFLYPSQEEFERVGCEKYARISETGTGSVETQWLTKDGQLIDVYLSSSAIDPDDLLAGVAFTALDITERKRAEEERRNLEARIQHAQKLESLGVLAGGIAHDFNNILHVILGNANLAARNLPEESRARDYLEEVRRSVDRAAGLCSQMLAYAGKGGLTVSLVNLGDVVRDIAKMLEVTISKKATLEIEVEPGLPPIEADASQVRQIVMNLITNASEALGNESGRIELTIASIDLGVEASAAEFPGEDLAAGRYVSLRARDTGEGMDEETQRRMFEPFFTTKFTGRGLGMAAVLGIVRGHRGAIRVESEEGEGSTITVLLPAAAVEAASDEKEGVADEAEQGYGTVLFVDDEPALRHLGEEMLRAVGYDVIQAGDGREAVKLFRQHRDEITAVVLDLTMPEMDGEEAFRVIHGIRPNVPVILCSGFSAEELADRFKAEAPTAFLKKPFTADELISVIGGATSKEARL